MPESVLVLLSSLFFVSIVYYGVVHVPDDMDSHDDVMWVYAQRRLTRTLVSKYTALNKSVLDLDPERYLIYFIFLQSIAGEYMFLGNRVVLSRSVAPFSSLPPVVDCSSVKVNPNLLKSPKLGEF